ncbi:ABC transporter ATP-binding protein [Lactobacillus panisapium]|uniref:ABC transporter ATP-binding protein n=1 Tax=Lactobacillus panisapium TaxID=2012495 RepID=UPI001C697551|nr:ABC transporter ATP-binding protein [Lactobacillus panisapium]QYN59632.1 ABC transporter ATP-binding protein [Lactobacillus panisapium]
MLNVDNVNTYISRTKIVKNASFKVAPGEIVGLIGPNGAGKTTIMKTILGLTSFSGKISIVNDPVTENNHQALSEVGALIEHPAVYPFLTGQQNLQLYSHNKEDLENIVSLLQMASFIQSKAKGYSLGMKQKLGIAIALLNKPKLIILDEPMNGLDIESTIRVRKIIKQYADRGTAFLISSHVLSELQKVMTQVILISGGKIIVNKPIEEFNQINHQKYKIIAENNNVALNILQKQGINYIYKDGNITINNEDVFKIQDELFKNKVYLKELVPIEANFEQIVVNILDKQKENNHD